MVKNKYPVDVFGVTDAHGKLHPISFMITSFETVYDFTLFYKSMIALAELLDLNFDPEYIMLDTCQASYNAARACFPNITILMCFFHVMQNVCIYNKKILFYFINNFLIYRYESINI